MSIARDKNFLSSGVSKVQDDSRWLLGRPAFLQIEQIIGLRDCDWGGLACVLYGDRLFGRALELL